jgi:hypothetical protein
MPYETVPGTVPHRALEWFKQQPPGTVVTTAVLGEALGVESNSFSTWLSPARKAGLLQAETRKGEGRTLYWSLGDGTPADEPEEDEDDRGTVAASGEEDFHFCIHSDGDVDLHGLIALENGGYRMTAEMFAKLRRVTTWMPPQ